MLAAGACVFALLTWESALISHDGVQYLSTASNLLSGRGLSTGALIYDGHYQDVLPAPQTVWPPGFPFLISLLSLTGLSPEFSALLINLLAQLLSAVCVACVLRRCGTSVFAAQVSAAAFFLLANPWLYAKSLLADPVTSLCILATLALIPSRSDYNFWRWLICGLLAALAITTRYSAVLFVAALLPTVYLIHLKRFTTGQSNKYRTILYLSLFAALPFFTFLILCCRNHYHTGNYMPTNGFNTPETPVETVAIFIRAAAGFLGFDSTRLPVAVNQLLFISIVVLLIISLLIAAYVLRTRPRQKTDNPSVNQYVRMILIVVALHALLFCSYFAYKTLTDSYPKLLPRYLFQIFGGLFIAYCLSVSRALRYCVSRTKTRTTLLVIIFLTFCLQQLGQTNAWANFDQQKTRYNTVSAILDTSTSSSPTLREVIERCYGNLQQPGSDSGPEFAREVIRGQQALWSNEGQLLHYLTGVPTLTLPGRNRTLKPYDMQRIQDEIKTYKIKLLILIDSNNGVTYMETLPTLQEWFSNAGFQQRSLVGKIDEQPVAAHVFSTHADCTIH